MKAVFLYLLLLIVNLHAWAQTATEYLDAGIAKHTSANYKGAIKDYSKAIKADATLIDAWFNRGSVKQELGDLDGAIKDFNQTIKLDDKYIRAYYSRGTALAGKKLYDECLPDLNKVVELDDTFPNIFTLRGQIHFALGAKAAACKDFKRAKEVNDPAADTYLSKYCGNEQQRGESLALHWPEEENWKIASSQENGETMMMELLRNDEELTNWTEMGNMVSIKGAVGITMDKAMNLIYDEAKSACKNAKLTFLDKDEKAEFPWCLFTVECARYKNTKDAESQLWYIVQGKTSLYTSFRAVKEATLAEELITKWSAFFKTGEIVYLDE